MGALAVGLLVLGAVLLGGGDDLVVRAVPEAEEVREAASVFEEVEAVAEPEPVLLVHVAGAVALPGVYGLCAGARVRDAVAAAGGLAPGADVATVNLAASVADGAKVTIPFEGEEPPPEVGFDGGGAPVEPGLVNVNTAGAAELEGLPGIGPSLAAAIVEERERGGPFASPEDLLRVSGIGEKKLGRLLGAVTV